MTIVIYKNLRMDCDSEETATAMERMFRGIDFLNRMENLYEIRTDSMD